MSPSGTCSDACVKRKSMILDMQSQHQIQRMFSASSSLDHGFILCIRSAFTIIELLVVIAIIAIPATILFAVSAQAREKARAAVCLSNSKQLGLAMMQCNQDYDETYTNGTYLYGFNGGRAGQVHPYIKSVGVSSSRRGSPPVRRG